MRKPVLHELALHSKLLDVMQFPWVILKKSQMDNLKNEPYYAIQEFNSRDSDDVTLESASLRTRK